MTRNSTYRALSYPERSAALYARAFDWADKDAIEAALTVNTAFNAQAGALSRLCVAMGINRTVGRHALIRLLYFAEGHRLTQFEVANEMQVTSSNVTFLVDGLEREGLVRRLPHPTDRRTVYVELTPEGKEFSQSLVPSMAKFMSAMLAGFDEAEKRTFISLLDRFRLNAESFNAANLDESSPEPPSTS